MSSEPNVSTQDKKVPGRGWQKFWKPVAAVLAVGIVWWWLGGDGGVQSVGTTFVVRLGPLEINVLEGGSIEALESQDIRSEIRGREGAKILSIVEEGYLVTAQDVEDKLLLVELDSSSLVDQLTNQEIQFQSTEAAFIEAEQAYDIQINQNESNIKSAELSAKFAHMDFKKYLGEKPVAIILAELGLDEDFRKNISIAESASAPIRPSRGRSLTVKRTKPTFEDLVVDQELMAGIRKAMMSSMGEGGFSPGAGRGGGGGQWRGQGGRSRGAGMRGGGGRTLNAEMIKRMEGFGIDVFAIAEELGKIKTPAVNEDEVGGDFLEANVALTYMRNRTEVDFSKYADADVLEDGEAKQQLRELQDNHIVSQEEFSLARTQYEGTLRLLEKKFVTQMDLDADKMRVAKSEIKVKSAETELELFIKYSFPKQAEKLFSDYEESLMKLGRTRKEAFAKLSQAKAKLRSAERRFNIEEDRLEDLRTQISKCVIRAERPGLVVYGTSGGNNMYRGGSQEPIQEGTTVRERQKIITIPDMTKMAVNVQVHESSVEKVSKGQRARIIVDARPNEVLVGEVIHVAPLPDSQNRWMNPDLKVYSTSVKIIESPEWLRPGMSAEVVIIVRDIREAVYVPMQAVRAEGKERVCYVLGDSGVERRVVETGDYTAEFVVILSGLQEGERVYLRPPDNSWVNVADEAEVGST